MDNLKRQIAAFHQAMDLIEIQLGQAFFMEINTSAKNMILNTLQQEILKTDPISLRQPDDNVTPLKQNRQSELGHSLSGATRAKPHLLKGNNNPLRVRGRFVAIGG